MASKSKKLLKVAMENRIGRVVRAKNKGKSGEISCPKSDFRCWQRLYIANVAEVTDIKITQYGLHTDYLLLFLADFGRSYTSMVLLRNIRIINSSGVF